MIKNELKNTNSIVYIPGSPKDEEKLKKAKEKFIPNLKKCFEMVGIKFGDEVFIEPTMDVNVAQEKIKNASFIMLMGGTPHDWFSNGKLFT